MNTVVGRWTFPRLAWKLESTGLSNVKPVELVKQGLLVMQVDPQLMCCPRQPEVPIENKIFTLVS
jgi:hypothetical protein